MPLVLEKCNVEELCIALGGSEKLLNQLRHELKEWLHLQPHLPQDVSEKRLEWLILTNKLSLERAKQKLNMYYTMRRLVPEILANRDPRGHDITSLHNVMQYAMLPKLGLRKCRTFICRLTNTDWSEVSPYDLPKYVSMVCDMRMIEDCSSGENYVVDVSMLSLDHIILLTPTTFKKCQLVAANAYAMRIMGIHFINASPLVNRIVTVMKSILSQKLMSRVHVHQAGNLESLYQFVPKSILPKDYGGDEPTMTELDASLRERVDEWREWFLKHERILVNECSRPSDAIKQESLFGYSGSFRKLEVD